MKKQLEMKDMDLEEMKQRLKDQEKERQSELLKLQLEVSQRLHRVSSGFCWTVHVLPVPTETEYQTPGMKCVSL